MNTKSLLPAFIFCFSLNVNAQNLIPEISNIRYQIQNLVVTIDFDVSDKENDPLDIQCKLFSMDDPNKFTEIIPDLIQGDIGFPISQGNGKQIRVYLNSGNPTNRIQLVLKTSDRQSLIIEDLLNQVDSNNLKAYVQQLQGIRNKNNQSFYDDTRNYLYTTLSSIVPARKIELTVPQYTCVNIESTKTGFSRPSNIYAIDAHYDSYNFAPGADDNASGVAGVLEAYRILAPYSSKFSLRFINFDLEEAGLVGSLLYTNNQLSKRDSIQGVINLEMIGFYSNEPNTQTLPTGFNILFPDAYNAVIANERRGDFITNVGNTSSVALKNSFHNNALKYIPDLKVISLEVPGTGTLTPDLRRSDHATFWDRGVPALMITDGANFRNKNYHTTKDSINNLNFLFMTNVVKACLASLIESTCIEHASHTEIPIQLSTNVVDKSNELFSIIERNKSILIKLTNTSSNTVFLLSDINGKVVYSSHIQKGNADEYQISIADLNQGMYIATIRTDHDLQSKKLIIHD